MRPIYSQPPVTWTPPSASPPPDGGAGAAPSPGAQTPITVANKKIDDVSMRPRYSQGSLKTLFDDRGNAYHHHPHDPFVFQPSSKEVSVQAALKRWESVNKKSGE